MTGVPYERGVFTPRTLIKLSMHGIRDAQLFWASVVGKLLASPCDL